MKNIYNAIFGQIISAIGTQIFVISVVLWLKRDFEATNLIGIFLALSTVPSLIMSPISGAIADFFSRRKLMIACDTLNSVLLILVGVYLTITPGLDSKFQLFIVIVLSLVVLIIQDIFAPANNSYLSHVIPEDKIQMLFGIRASLLKSTQFIGQSVGGYLFLNLSIAGICILNGASFLISALMELFLEKDQAMGTTEKRISAYINKVKEGFAISLENQPLLFFFLGACFTNGLSAICLGVFPFYVENILKFELSYYPFIISFIGVGAFIAGYTAKYPLLDVNKKIMVPLFLTFPGISFILVSAFHFNPFILMFWMFLNGFTFTTIGIYMFKVITVSFKNSHRGRAFAILFSLSVALNPIGYLLSSYISSHFMENLSQAFLIVGALICLVWTIILINKNNRHFLLSHDS